MKYRVKAGEKLVVVVVDGDEKPRIRWATVVMTVVVAVLVTFTVTAVYGAVTGDYEPLRSVAQYFQQIVEVVVSHVRK